MNNRMSDLSIQPSFKRIVLAVFLVALITLAAEITLSRIFSVITYYYLAFLAISVAMLGLTAGSVTVYLAPRYFTRNNFGNTLQLSAALLGFSLIICAVAVCFIPVTYGNANSKFINTALLVFFCSLPFYFAGIFITGIITKTGFNVNKLYAADLAGAALGCLVVLAGISYMSAPYLLFSLAIIGPLTVFILGKTPKKAALLFSAITIILLAAGFSLSGKLELKPRYVKGQREVTGKFMYEKWNSHSRVTVEQMHTDLPQLWGPSPVLNSSEKTDQYKMTIDGDAGTVLRRFTSPEQISHLQYDLTSIAYPLRPNGRTCIIGVGGGKDIQTALLYGQKEITGIDVNPVFIDLLNNRFHDWAGIAGNKAVQLVNDEARSWLSRHQHSFSIIQMALIDTWAATGAGAFSLTENNLYTTEAWDIFLDRLDSNGILTVSRWYNPSDLGETGRLTALAVATLLKRGVHEPAKHIALVTINNLATLLVCKTGFSENDLTHLKENITALQFNPVIIPGQPVADETLRQIMEAKTLSGLKKVTATHQLNLEPPTDDNPYFFNMLRLKNLSFGNKTNNLGVMEGNLVATRMLFLLIGILSFFAFATILLPLFLQQKKTKQTGRLLPFTLYFSLLGAGFMLVEIALVQKLNVLLGRPVFALGILLFTIILSTGIGSFISEKLVEKKSRLLMPLITALAIVVLALLLSPLTRQLASSSLFVKIILSIVILFPAGILMGCFLPMGIRLAAGTGTDRAAWLWGLNGIFGVLFSAIAVFISIYIGISYNLYLAAVFYLCLIPLLRNMSKQKQTGE
jgi:hypothetical protein